ncbi:DNA helicase PriA [Methanovulcanius yangii]|uniref:DNA helicase PriA n=1 Tax=Methanovulcanius yangii TaxID=1789227 RepID=UPI0029CA810F|nr:DNA helicase PriA [Methanovulcanius yangii]
MLRHTCGYEADVHCRKCGRELIYHEKNGLYCPYCGRKVTMICPGCGKPWL